LETSELLCIPCGDPASADVADWNRRLGGDNATEDLALRRVGRHEERWQAVPKGRGAGEPESQDGGAYSWQTCDYRQLPSPKASTQCLV
jgi:hypothetical protein|tara:strand:+ start:9301 stop:9567 length:267 start_codon:yes stop_codon:yes gene_type:complete